MIPVNIDTSNNIKVVTYSQIFLSTNGKHVDIIIPINNVANGLQHSLVKSESDKFLGFGWGDADFYLNTPNIKDLTAKTAFKAMLINSSALMHVKQFKNKQADWITVPVTLEQNDAINVYIQASFEKNKQGDKLLLANKGYSEFDNFYKAKGSYSLLKTCNTWANTGFKESGLKASLWTPFDKGLISKHIQKE